MLIAHTVNFFPTTAAEWTAAGTWALVVGAFFAGRYAKRQVDSAREQVAVLRRTRDEETRPYVITDIELSRHERNVLLLVVENIGRTPAKNVKVTFEPPLRTTLAASGLVEGGPLLDEGIAFMPPGRRVEVLFDISHDRVNKDLPLRHVATVESQDTRGRDLPAATYVIDLSFWLDQSPRYDTFRGDMADAAARIADALDSSVDTLRQIDQRLAPRPSHDEVIEAQLAALSEPTAPRQRPASLLERFGQWVHRWTGWRS